MHTVSSERQTGRNSAKRELNVTTEIKESRFKNTKAVKKYGK